MTTTTTTAPPAPAAGAKAARTRTLLEAPILPTLLRLGAPNVLNLIALTVIVTADGFFVGWLGPIALAGVSLVFPVKMLMQHMAASGMGGAVTSAIARALGSGRKADADRLAVHGVVIAVAMAALFSALVLLGGEALFRAMGGADDTVAAALTYAHIVFLGTLTPWLFNTLASIVRGTGNMTLPATAIVSSALADLVLAPVLIFGWGRFPPSASPAPGSASWRRSSSAP